jgi:predicted nucleic acid-binding Zn ribbon protein
MRKSNTQPLKDVLRAYIDALGHRRKLKEVNIIASWEALMGKTIARNTREIYIKNKVLFVYLDSAALRNELLFYKEKIVAHLNEHAGEEIVEKVVLR